MKKYLVMLLSLFMLSACSVKEVEVSPPDAFWISRLGGKKVTLENNGSDIFGTFSTDATTFSYEAGNDTTILTWKSSSSLHIRYEGLYVDFTFVYIDEDTIYLTRDGGTAVEVYLQ